MVNNQFNGSTPVGYDALVAKFNLQVIPNWHHSRTNQSSIRETHTETGQVVEVYPSRYGRGLGPCARRFNVRPASQVVPATRQFGRLATARLKCR